MLVGAGIILAVVLAFLGQSFLVIGVIGALAVVVVGFMILRNDTDLVMPILIYSMWFEGLGTGYVSVGRIAASLVPLVIIMRMATSSWKPPALQPRAWVPVALLTTWAFAGAFYITAYSTFTVWFFQFLTFCLGVAYYLGAAIFHKGPKQIETLLRRWMWMGAPIALLGLLIFFTLGNRIFGLTGGPNTYAAYVQMLMPLIVVFARRSEGWRRWAYWSLIPVYLGALLSSGSRGGLIGTAVVGVYVLLTLPRVTPERRLVVVVGGLASMVGLFFLFGVLSPDRFSVAAIIASRGTGRLDIWHAAFQVLHTHWLFGIGIGGFSPNAVTILQNSNNTNLQLLNSQEVRDSGGIVAQNLYLQIMLDMGAIGLALYIGIIATTIKNLWDLRNTEWGELAWAFIGSLIGGLVAGMFASQYNQKFVWLIIGIAASGFIRQRLTAPRSARMSRPEPAMVGS
jgi:hypothetical protein